MSGYFGKKPGFRVQPLTLSQIWTQLAGTARTISGLWTFSTTPKFSALTSGSIPFISTGGQVSQDNAALFWDETNDRVGLTTTSPAARLDARDANNSQIAFGTAADQMFAWGFTSYGTVGWGGKVVSGAWQARQTVFSAVKLSNASGSLQFNSGLTIGNSFTPTDILSWNATGVGVGATPTCKATVAGTVQITSLGNPTSGVGMELAYDSAAGNAYVTAYDRGGSVFKKMTIRGSTIALTQDTTPAIDIASSRVTLSMPIVLKSYTTATRPSHTAAAVIYDSTLGLPIFSDGATYKNFAGAAV